MKNCKLLASVALATFMASCADEELVDKSPVMGLQKDRPMVNVEVAFDEGEVATGKDANSRLAFGQNENGGYEWSFADGDRIGAFLMDEWDGQGCGIQHFNFVDYVHTNYAFIRKTEGGKTSWVTPEQAPVCEGNYFFYFPYKSEFNHRGYVGWNVNPDQKNYDENGKYNMMQAVEDNQRWIGYKWIGDEAQGAVNRVDIQFVPLFAMPSFKIENGTGYELQVKKLILRSTSNDTNDKIDPYGQSDLLATTMVLAPKSGEFNDVNQLWDTEYPKLGKNAEYEKKTAQMWRRAQRLPNFKSGNDNYVWPVADANATSLSWNADGKTVYNIAADSNLDDVSKLQPTYNYTVSFGDNYFVGAGDDIKSIMVVPAGVYEYLNQNSTLPGNKQTFEVILEVAMKTQSGQLKDKLVRIDLGQPQTSGALNNSNYDDILSGKVNKFLPAGQFSMFKAKFDYTALQDYEISDWKVSTSSELSSLIDKLDNSAVKKVLVQTMGNRVVMTKEIEQKLASKPKLQLMVNGQITIGEDCSEDAINKLYFFSEDDQVNANDKHEVITELTITNKQVKKAEMLLDDDIALENVYTEMPNCVITIKKGGELNTVTNGIDIITSAINIEEGGKLNAHNIKIENINNAAGNKPARSVANAGELTIAGSLTTSLPANWLVLDNAETGVATIEGLTEGSIKNNGTLTVANVDGTVQNGLIAGVEANATFTGDSYQTVRNQGTIVTKNEVVFHNHVMNAPVGVLTIEKDATFEQIFVNVGNTTGRATVNVKGGISTIKFGSDNSGDINVAAEAELVSREAANNVLRNRKGGIINVEGKLLDKVQNSGLINCINHGQVIVNGYVADDNQNGIIDVTKADDTHPAQAAKDYENADRTKMNSFRYTVNAETTAADLDAALKARISSHNYGKNPIIVIWGTESPVAFSGKVNSNVERVAVLNNLVISDVTEFMKLRNQDGTRSTLNAFVIAEDATLTIANDAKFKLGNYFNGTTVYATIDGEFKINNQATVTAVPSVEVYGNGRVQNESGRFTNWATAGSWNGEWVNQ